MILPSQQILLSLHLQLVGRVSLSSADPILQGSFQSVQLTLYHDVPKIATKNLRIYKSDNSISG